MVRSDEIVAFGFFEDEYPQIVRQEDATSEILEPLTLQQLIKIANMLSKELTELTKERYDG